MFFFAFWVCRWETHGWQINARNRVPAKLAAKSHASLKVAEWTHCVLWTKMETFTANPPVSEPTALCSCIFSRNAFHLAVFVYSVMLFRVRPLLHLRGSSLQNIWWHRPSLPRSIHLRPHPGTQCRGSQSGTLGGAGEEHQTWGQQEDFVPGSGVHWCLWCQCPLLAEEGCPGQ